MTPFRIYHSAPLASEMTVTLSSEASHHISHVLRAKVSDLLTIFNGEGGEYVGVIVAIDKKNVTVKLQQKKDHDNESPLELILAQGISRGEKMDFTIQKAVELGVKKIIPLLTERCNVKLDAERREKRLQHWRAIVVSACEQCGRNRLPEVVSPQPFEIFLKNIDADWKFVLAPLATQTLSKQVIEKNARVVLCIGPEGGLSEKEIQQAMQQHFLPLNLGPRILRTETAAIAALSTLQFYAGDLA